MALWVYIIVLRIYIYPKPKIFGALVAEVEPDKLLNFWDFEAISRRSTKTRSSSSKHEASQSKHKKVFYSPFFVDFFFFAHSFFVWDEQLNGKINANCFLESKSTDCQSILTELNSLDFQVLRLRKYFYRLV